MKNAIFNKGMSPRERQIVQALVNGLYEDLDGEEMFRDGPVGLRTVRPSLSRHAVPSREPADWCEI